MSEGTRGFRPEHVEALTGRARYAGDLELPGMLHAAVYRSPVAHARIRRVDVSAARHAPGVVLALAGADLPGWVGPQGKFPFFTQDPFHLGRRIFKWFDHYCLALDKVRFEGEALAVVVATSRYAAEDALELVEADLEPLPPVTSAAHATEPDAPTLYDEWGDNVMITFRVSNGDLEEAFARADLVVSEQLYSHRFTGTPIQPRAVAASYDPDQALVNLWSATQIPHNLSVLVPETLRIPHLKVVVRTERVGGGYGMKWSFYPEDTLVPVCAILTGRPVKWVETRREHMAATVHAREQTHDVEMALGKDGTIRGLRDRIRADIGAAYPHGGLASAVSTVMFVPGAYRIENYQGEVQGIVTNKTPFGAHRGFGKSEAAYVVERMVNIAAQRLGMDPAEVRRVNFIRPEAFPYVSATGSRYDSAQYSRAQERAMELADYDGWRRRREEARRAGRYLGIGTSVVIEPSSSTRMGSYNAGYYSVAMKMDPGGRLYLFTSGGDEGQGHAEAFARIAEEELGIDPGEVYVVEGDTLRCPFGSGSYSSRFSVVGSSAAVLAARRLKGKMATIAAHLLGEPEETLEFREGKVVPAGREEYSMSLARVSHAAYLELYDLPDDMEPGLEVTYSYRDPNVNFRPDDRGRVAMFSSVPYDATVAVVEVDPETGRLDILKYVSVHDCGRVLNAETVRAQHVGALAHGIGGALLEELRYDADGQLQNHTFKEYLIPTAMEMPEFTLDHIETPNPFTPTGMKGTGETGTISPPPALSNAVEDALAPLGVTLRGTPLSPDRLWAAIHGARREG